MLADLGCLNVISTNVLKLDMPNKNVGLNNLNNCTLYSRCNSMFMCKALVVHVRNDGVPSAERQNSTSRIFV